MPIRSVFICQIETIKSFTLASFKNKLTYQGLSFLIFKMGFICGIFKKKKKNNSEKEVRLVFARSSERWGRLGAGGLKCKLSAVR